MRLKHTTALAATLVVTATASAAKPRGPINLVDFGRVVEMPGQPAGGIPPEHELMRGADGWDAVRGADGEYVIGVEWDSPREISEVNIEFRHAIANRDKIRVQYWQEADADTSENARTAPAGRWMTPRWEWWAGDRDVSYAFLPCDREGSGRRNGGRAPGGGEAGERGIAEDDIAEDDIARDDTARDGIAKGGDPAGGEACEAGCPPHRRTRRIRFLCGKDDLPPVRYLRAYGPGKATTATFDLRFDADAKFAPPVLVKTVNCYVISADGKVAMESAALHERSGTLRVRYYRQDTNSPNRSRLLIARVADSENRVEILPARVAREGRLRPGDAGLVLEHRGGPVTTRPSRR